jgi:poly(beta-D-mannuronate) lyase
MKPKIILLFLICCIISVITSCSTKNSQIRVTTEDELKTAIREAQEGTNIVLANGTWKDIQIRFYGNGTKQAPISLSAETPGKVFLEGQSNIHLGGTHLVVNGLYFRNGYSPNKGVIRFKIGTDSTAFYSRVTHTVVDGFTQPNRWENDRWIELYGKHNHFDHNYIAGKSNDGATFMVYHDGNEHTDSYHQIVNNYFGPRPRKGGPRAETLRLGGSETSMTPGNVTIANNFFDRCNGEVEIISDKTNFNKYLNNIFYKCEGSMVMRHGNYTKVDGNLFIGDDDSDFYGGIRVVSTGHWITNNYFYKIRGEQFRSPLALMNGIPKSSLNRYKQVTDVVIAYNTWVDCNSPIQIGVGQNNASKDVLPISEIRSAPPIRTILANNLIYNTVSNSIPLVNHDDKSGISFKNNIISNAGILNDSSSEFKSIEVEMNQVNEWLFIPSKRADLMLEKTYNGFSFDRIKNDLFGTSRSVYNQVGAVSDINKVGDFKINKSMYGPAWFIPENDIKNKTIHKVSASGKSLEKVLKEALSGDVVELTSGLYSFDTPLVIDKEITIKAKADTNPILQYNGLENSSAFEIHALGRLELNEIILRGNGTQTAFAPLKENMSAAYKLFLKSISVENFDHILLASTGSFADSIGINKSHFRNSKNGFVLAADKKGDYNAEMFSIVDSSFENIDKNLIHFYRGGYDESTIGGVLTVSNSTFQNNGQLEKSGVLIKTRGIINVLLDSNHFINNPVRRVAVLWGVKNNKHQNNSVLNSGKIEVQEQQELEILY